MRLPFGIYFIVGLLLCIQSDVTNAQYRRPSTLARSLGINPKATAQTTDTFECPEEFGYYPHPSDCSHYYVCVFGGALLESCTGGLMYSHELQTCDWPRNVGCEVSDDSTSQQHSGRQQKQHDAYHVVPSKFRFSSISSTPQTERFPETIAIRHSTLAPTSSHSISPIQQTLPPPPDLRIAPNPVITSRGQPKPFEHIDIAKLYTEAHDSLPPIEEEESDRQQRVYRGQPSTVGQVQRDRDGLITQHVNGLPGYGKVGSFAFGSQINQQHKVESSSSLPQAPEGNRNYYNATNNQEYNNPTQQFNSYFSVYDDTAEDSDLYRDDYSAQYNNNNNNNNRNPSQPKYVQTTYRPSTATAQTISTSTKKLIPQREQSYISTSKPTYEQSVPAHEAYNPEYDEALVAQLEADNEYDQPTKTEYDQPAKTQIRDNDEQYDENGDYDFDLISDRPYQVLSSTIRAPIRPAIVSISNSPILSSTQSHFEPTPTPISSTTTRSTTTTTTTTTRKPSPQTTSTLASTTIQYNHDDDTDIDLTTLAPQETYNSPNSERTNTRNRGSSHYTSGGHNDDRTASGPAANRGTHPPRSRPTLKPAGAIVSKATEFVDIYRHPPTRADALYPQPIPDKTAAKCRKDVCLLPDCSCGGKEIPGGLAATSVPQIVLLTFDDAINDINKQIYADILQRGRTNPNGCPITATFYVSHEWTDYSQVQNLYADGHEMASHTVSHSFGEQFSQKKWTREVAGQREILAAYGGVKLNDVRGMRAPFLSIGGNKMFKMLYDSNFTYDSSMPVYENRPPSWPYTLDYKLFHDCMIPPCPTRSYPGVWQVPMVMWQDLNGGRCSMGDACSNPPDADGVEKMIMKNFDRHYTTNRAPFGLFYHAAWFTQPHHKEGFIKFLDKINAMNHVWIVTNWQALQWVRDPTPLSRLNSFQPFQCNYQDRPKRCNNPKVCNLWHKSGVRYMRTCQPCPEIYPWTGKSGIRSSRVDHDIDE